MPHAAHYFRRILELRGGERGGDGAPEVQEALSFLANFCKERGELREASQYCTRLVDSGSQFKEEAKAMLREIHARGHQIGIHPGYNTYRHPEAIARSVTTLRRVLDEEDIEQPLLGGRQLYLR